MFTDDEKDPLAGLAPAPATPAPAAKPAAVASPESKPKASKPKAKPKMKAAKPKPRRPKAKVRMAKPAKRRGRPPGKAKARKPSKGKSTRAPRGSYKPPKHASGEGKPGRPRGSAVDSWKLRTTGKNLPRKNTVRFMVCGAFTRPRIVSAAVASLSKGFRPPELGREVIKHNAAKYFRVVIVSLLKVGALRKVK